MLVTLTAGRNGEGGMGCFRAEMCVVLTGVRFGGAAWVEDGLVKGPHGVGIAGVRFGGNAWVEDGYTRIHTAAAQSAKERAGAQGARVSQTHR